MAGVRLPQSGQYLVAGVLVVAGPGEEENTCHLVPVNQGEERGGRNRLTCTKTTPFESENQNLYKFTSISYV